MTRSRTLPSTMMDPRATAVAYGRGVASANESLNSSGFAVFNLDGGCARPSLPAARADAPLCLRQANDQTSDEGVHWAPARCVLVSDGFSGDPGPDPAAGRLLDRGWPTRAPPAAAPRAAPAAGPARSGSSDGSESAGSLSPVSSAGDVLLGELPGPTDPAPAWQPSLRSPAASPRGGGGGGGGDGGGGVQGSADYADSSGRPDGGGRARSGEAGGGGDPASSRPERGGGEGLGGGFGAGRVPQVVSRGGCLNGSSYPSPHLDGGGRGAGAAAQPARARNILCNTRVSRPAPASKRCHKGWRWAGRMLGRACTCASAVHHTRGERSHEPGACQGVVPQKEATLTTRSSSSRRARGAHGITLHLGRARHSLEVRAGVTVERAAPPWLAFEGRWGSTVDAPAQQEWFRRAENPVSRTWLQTVRRPARRDPIAPVLLYLPASPEMLQAGRTSPVPLMHIIEAAHVSGEAGNLPKRLVSTCHLADGLCCSAWNAAKPRRGVPGVQCTHADAELCA